MRWKEYVPATTSNTTSTSTMKRCRNAIWTMRWIMEGLMLQGVLELEEEAAVADDTLAFF